MRQPSGDPQDIPRASGAVVHVRRSPFVQFTPGYTYVGRDFMEFRDEGFGNPFVMGKDGNRKQVLAKYLAYAEERIRVDPVFRERVKNLKNQIIGCWCCPQGGFKGKLLCHGQILLALAEGLQ